MKKSVKIRLFSLVVAAAILGGAVTAAAIMGSPYETLKYAVLDALTERNSTIDGAMTTSVNGVQMETAKMFAIQGDDSSLVYRFDSEGNNDGFLYSTNGLSINSLGFAMDDGTEWYSANVYPSDIYRPRTGMASFFSNEERNSAAMRFFELLADAVIGDLKNNITMTSENGIRRIQGTLTESQVPELVKAGLDMLVEQSGGGYRGGSSEVSFDGRVYVYEDYTISGGVKSVTVYKQKVFPTTAEQRNDWENGTFYDNLDGQDFWGVTYIDGAPFINDGASVVVDQYTAPATADDYGDYADGDWYNTPLKSVAIKYIHGEADVDMDGNLLRVDISGACTVTDVFGKDSELEVKAAADFSDIGTSDPACPIPGAEQLLTSEFIYSLFGSERMNVYFTLNADGSINESSVTTAYPWEWKGMASHMPPMAAAGDSPAYQYAVDMPASYEVTAIVPADFEVPEIPEVPDLDW